MRERNRTLEGQLHEAISILQTKDELIADEKQRVEERNTTIRFIALTILTFFEDNIPNWADAFHRGTDEPVMRIIADYAGEDPAAMEYVRVPTGSLATQATELRAAHAENAKYKKVLAEQLAMIKDQGRELDANLKKYEEAVKTVESKKHEVLLLDAQNQQLRAQSESLQASLTQAKTNAANHSAHVDSYRRRLDELMGKFQSTKTAQELELDRRDAEIDDLRRKLGSAREEVLARRQDVKNVLAQSQGRLPPQPPIPSIPSIPSAQYRSSNASKALRFFGMEKDRDKIKKGTMAGSQSTMGLSSVDLRYSTKEVAPAVDKEALRHRPSLQTPMNVRAAHSTPNTPISAQRSSDPVGMAAPGPQYRPVNVSPATIPPRMDSLQAMRYGPHSNPVSPVNRDKPLPSEPLPPPQMATARLAGAITRVESPLQAQITSDYIHHGIMGQTQSARRVLSRITEVSTNVSRSDLGDGDQSGKLDDVHEDDDVSENSMGSSEREMYHKTILASKMLDASAGLPYSPTERNLQSFAHGPGCATGTGTSSKQGYRSRDMEARGMFYDGAAEETQVGRERVLHFRAGSRDLRGARDSSDGVADLDPEDTFNTQYSAMVQGRPQSLPAFYFGHNQAGASVQTGPRDRFSHGPRESLASNVSSTGYRSEDSEPKTVAELYHQGGRHIRG
jgi:hypothetical protein